MDGGLTAEHTIDPQRQSSLVEQVQTRHETPARKTKRRICVVSIVIVIIAIWGCFEALCIIGDFCFPPDFNIYGWVPPRSPTTAPPTQGIWTSSELQTSRASKSTLRAQTRKAKVLTEPHESGTAWSRFSSPATWTSTAKTAPSIFSDTRSPTSQRSSLSTVLATTSPTADAFSSGNAVRINATTSAGIEAASHVVIHDAQTGTASSTGASFAIQEANSSSSPDMHSTVFAAPSHTETSDSVRKASAIGSPLTTFPTTESATVQLANSTLRRTATSMPPQASSPSGATTSVRKNCFDTSAGDRRPLELYDPDCKPGIETIPGIPEHLKSMGQMEQWFTKLLPVPKLFGDLYLPMVTSSIADCASVGKDLMMEGGSAVDAAIASQICHGFLNPVSAGVGGGSFMTVYDEGRNLDVVFNAREAAPMAVDVHQYERNRSLAVQGGLAIAIPGEIEGFHRAWKRFGKVAWERLFTRTIYWCEQGYHVSLLLEETIRENQDFLRSNEVLREDYLVNGMLLRKGDKLRRRRLGHTLRRIAHDPMSFYNGSLANDILLDVAEHGARWTTSDLSDYRASTSPALRYHLPNAGLTLLAPPPPSLAAMVGHALSIADGFRYVPSDWDPKYDDIKKRRHRTWTLHQVVEAMKYAIALRDNIGDPTINRDVKEFMELSQRSSFAETDKNSIRLFAFNYRSYFKRLYANETTPELTVDVGVQDAVQTSVVDEEGLRVSLTSSIGKGFGSQVVGRRTGIVFNNAMADFSTVKSTMFKKRVNWIAPGARPTSLMVPVIIVNTAFRAEATLGATRGLRGVSSLIWTILDRYIFQVPLQEIQDRPQYLPDLISNTVEVHADRTWNANVPLMANTFAILLRQFGHKSQWISLKEEPQAPSLMKMEETRWFGHPFRRHYRHFLSYSGVA